MASISIVDITTVEDQEDGSSEYKYVNLQTALALNSIRETLDFIEQGVPVNFVPGLVSKLAQTSAEIVTWLVREEEEN
jgi:hypothetical protein